MFAAIVGLYEFIVGLFASGGFIAGLSAFFTGAITSIITVLTGGFAKVAEVWAYIFAYHTVEILRRFILIALISVILGYVINYAMVNLLIYDGSSLSTLMNSYINSISSYGPVGVDFLVFANKLGLFDALKIILNVMIFTLTARVALSILFK